MTPQVVDFDADGINDMIMGTFEGHVFLVRGTKDGYAPPTHVLDRAGDKVRISMYWDDDAGDYLHVDRTPEGEPWVKGHHLTSATMTDWDADGDLDLILGAYEGGLYLCENEGSAKAPKYATTNRRIQAGGTPIEIAGGLATPRVVDWDGDGLFDLLCGGAKGGLYLYTNTGTASAPAFASAVTLIENVLPEPGPDMDYFDSLMVPTGEDKEPTAPGSSWHVEAVDYDHDGDLDLLVGAQSYCRTEAKVLTEAEEARLAELRAEERELESEFMERFEAMGDDQDAIMAFYESKEGQELNQRMMRVFEGISELVPRPRVANYVWLYRNTTDSKSRASAN